MDTNSHYDALLAAAIDKDRIYTLDETIQLFARTYPGLVIEKVLTSKSIIKQQRPKDALKGIFNFKNFRSENIYNCYSLTAYERNTNA